MSSTSAPALSRNTTACVCERVCVCMCVRVCVCAGGRVSRPWRPDTSYHKFEVPTPTGWGEPWGGPTHDNPDSQSRQRPHAHQLASPPSATQTPYPQPATGLPATPCPAPLATCATPAAPRPTPDTSTVHVQAHEHGLAHGGHPAVQPSRSPELPTSGPADFRAPLPLPELAV